MVIGSPTRPRGNAAERIVHQIADVGAGPGHHLEIVRLVFLRDADLDKGVDRYDRIYRGKLTEPELAIE